jgi:hypothetical protein
MSVRSIIDFPPHTSTTGDNPLMKPRYSFKNIALFALAFVLVSSTASVVRAQGNFSFKVHNGTQETIKMMLVSEDGATYGKFDIGSGIEPGQTETLVWNKSTDDQDCSQFFKAVFDDGSESAEVEFDFCEEGLVLEFDE